MLSHQLKGFKETHPERFFNVGIAEANLMGVAAGLALDGKIPFATTFAAFASMRAHEQVRSDIAYPGLPVKIVGTMGGPQRRRRRADPRRDGGSRHDADDAGHDRDRAQRPAPPHAVRRAGIRAALGPSTSGSAAATTRSSTPRTSVVEIGTAIRVQEGSDATIIVDRCDAARGAAGGEPLGGCRHLGRRDRHAHDQAARRRRRSGWRRAKPV